MSQEHQEKQIGWREFERSNDDVVKAENFKISIKKVFVRIGFNKRDLAKPETIEKINRIKESYKAGRYVRPIEVALDRNDGVSIVDGECRFTALNLANKELIAEGKAPIEMMLCIPFKGNDVDQLIHMVLGNEGEKLTPLEVAEVVKKLLNQHWSVEKICGGLGYSRPWVEKLDFLSNVPEAVKRMIRADQISVDVAVSKVKQLGGEKALIALQLLIDASTNKSDGTKTKVTAKSTDSLPKIGKKIAAKVHAVVRSLPIFEIPAEEFDDEGEYSLKLSGAAIKALMEMQSQLQPKIDEKISE
jgi:ParB family chromosome partitioning protein